MPEFSLPFDSPAWVFLTLMTVALAFPIAAERLRLPGVLGLVLGGLIVGPQVLGLLELPGLVAQLGGFGVLYLMFLAALELDLEVLKQGIRRTAVFGILTFVIPITLGIAVSLAAGFRVAAAVLIGSLWASHTLVTYPTIRRHGLTRDPAVTATLGATIVTDVLALLVLAVVVALERSDNPPTAIGIRLALGMVVLGAVAFVLIPRLTLWFFRGLGQDGILRFLWVMCALLGVAVVADLAGTEPIVGAFFAGLALNRLIPDAGLLMRRIEFVGSSLLIPIFLISVGMLIDLSVVREARTLALAAAFSAVTIIAKYAAAWITGRVFGFGRSRINVMFSLSVAQAAATLAAAVIGFEAGIIDEPTVNAALIVVLVTVLLASWTAGRAVPRVETEPAATPKIGRRVIVPISNLDTAAGLVDLALTAARVDRGTVIPLHVVTEPDPASMADGARLRAEVETIARRRGAEVTGTIRVDVSVVAGISNTVMESDASLVVVGWTEASSVRRAVLGSLVDEIAARVPAPVAVSHLPHMDVDRVVIIDVAGASPVEIAVARRLGLHLARSGGWKIGLACRDPNEFAPGGPFLLVSTADFRRRDLIVVAAPGGADFARVIGELVTEHAQRPLVAIRAFAGTPNNFTPVAQMFGD